ncbi:hypothetical protein [Vibrio taketomensis]|uniref:hypothetical protein n=1 Tax=Vibrio taketomensis TaxID=2572923 RepID=UPI001389BAF7|nr:hypothetical protein [Vibrio taketomensis]
MITQDVSRELEQVITQLSKEGKEPTVALVKARLTSSVPMPALISTIKSWKNSQRVPKVEVAVKEPSQIDRINELEAQVKELTQRLAAIEAKLQ